MRHLYTIRAFGVEPIPWSPPRFGRGRRKDGTTFTFTTKGQKDRLAEGRVGLVGWQQFVKSAAREVVGKDEPTTEPLHVHYEFFGVTPPGRRHGELWDVKIEFNKKKGKDKKGAWVKKSRMGYPEADATNLVKSTEDALAGVVFHDDANNRMMSVVCMFGPMPGVRITVNLIEPDDFPGKGEIVK